MKKLKHLPAILLLLLLLASALLLAIPARAQSFTLSESSPYTATRVGLNIDGLSYYAGYLLKNLITTNPAMQPTIWAQNQESIGSSAGSSFEDDNVFNTTPANWWNPRAGTFYVTTGANAGCTGTITANTTANNSSKGVTFTLSPACPHSFASFDTMVTYIPKACMSSGLPGSDPFDNFGWNYSGGVTVDCTTGDFPPAVAGYQPAQVLKLTNSATLSTNFDTAPGFLGYNFSGTYTISLMTDKISGSATIAATVQRSGGVNGSCTLTPATGWSTSSCTFSASETPSTSPGVVQISYTQSGTGVTNVLGASLTSNSDTNGSAYRNQVANDFNASGLNTGSCRYWAEQNGETLDNWITPALYRSPDAAAGGQSYASYQTYQQGLYEFLTFAEQNCGGHAWVEVPLGILPAQAANLVDFIAGSSSTTYGAKRAALGHSAAFTSTLTRIVLEYWNEPWNQAGSTQNQNLTYNGGSWNYIPLAISFCTDAKADANWVSTVMKCAAGIQTGSNFWAGQLEAADTGHKVDLQANNAYGSNTITNFSGGNQWTSAYVEAWAAANDASNSTYYQTFAASPLTAQYEYQNNTVSGSGTITQGAATGYPEGEGYALVDALWPMWIEKKFKSVDENFFTYYQNGESFSNAAGNYNIALWGLKTGLGGAFNNPRPSYYGLQITNNCIGAQGIGFPVGSASIPTFSFSGYNGVAPESPVPYLQAFEFAPTSSSRCLVVYNTDTASSHTFAVGGTNAPTGSVAETLLTASALTTGNEGAHGTINVQPSTSTVTNPGSFSLPAHSMLAIAWTVGGSSPASVTLSGQIALIPASGGIYIP